MCPISIFPHFKASIPFYPIARLNFSNLCVSRNQNRSVRASLVEMECRYVADEEGRFALRWKSTTSRYIYIYFPLFTTNFNKLSLSLSRCCREFTIWPPSEEKGKKKKKGERMYTCCVDTAWKRTSLNANESTYRRQNALSTRLQSKLERARVATCACAY